MTLMSKPAPAAGDSYPPALFDYKVTPMEVPRSESRSKLSRVTLTLIVTNGTGKSQACSAMAFRVPSGDRPDALVFSTGSIVSDSAEGTRWSIVAAGSDTFVATPDPGVTGLEVGESIAFFLRDVEVVDTIGKAEIEVFEDCGEMRSRPLPVYKVEPGLAITSFTVDRVQVSPGDAVTLAWTTTGGVDAHLRDAAVGGSGFSEPVPLDGRVTRSPIETTIYTLDVEGANGTEVSRVSAQLTVTVARVKILSFTAVPAVIAQGGPALLRWHVRNASEGYISPGHLPAMGEYGEVRVTPDTTTNYTLQVKTSGSYNDDSRPLVVEVRPVIINGFKAEPQEIDLAGSSMLTWNTEWSTSVVIEPLGVVAESGRLVVEPQSDTEYTLIAKGASGPVRQSTTVRVRPTGLLPVGTIQAFAGPLSQDMQAQGWMYCDGRELLAAEHPWLFQAVGSSFGSASAAVFNLPDLRGLFLRGVAGTSGRDPNVDSRPHSAPGGATGNAVGSAQTYGTAPPKQPFRMTYANLGIVEGSNDAGCQTRPAAHNAQGQDVRASGGGDAESRPVNKAIYFIIKHEMVTKGRQIVVPPIGTVISFAGSVTPDANVWRLCDGSAVQRAAFSELAVVIGGAHGDSGPDEFLLPDYRGYFLRGVDDGTKRDPDARARLPPNPTAPPGRQGNCGDAVGSAQDWATALAHTPLLTAFQHLPTEDSRKQVDGSGVAWRLAIVNGGGQTMALTEGEGGDTETRPRNASVNWYIRVA